MAWKNPVIEIPAGNEYNYRQAVYLPDGKRKDRMGGYRMNFDSLPEFVEAAVKAEETLSESGDGHCAMRRTVDEMDSWYVGTGASAANWDGLMDMAANGWHTMAAKVRQVSDHAIQTADQLADELMPQMSYADFGDEPDLGRYYDGESDYMIDTPFLPTPTEGRVITLIASICVSAGVSTQVMVERGCAVAGLAEALTMMGYSVEIIVDISAGRDPKNGAASLTVKVKHATDNLDMPRVIFALAHPSMLRVFAFLIWDHGTQRNAMGGGYGKVLDPAPRSDGIIMPGVDVRHDWANDAEQFIKEQLERLNLI